MHAKEICPSTFPKHNIHWLVISVLQTHVNVVLCIKEMVQTDIFTQEAVSWGMLFAVSENLLHVLVH